MSSSSSQRPIVSLPISQELLGSKLAEVLTELFDGSEEDPLRPLLAPALERWLQDPRHDQGLLEILKAEVCQIDLVRAFLSHLPDIGQMFKDWLEQNREQIIDRVAERLVATHFSPVDTPLFDAILERAADHLEFQPQLVPTPSSHPAASG